MPIHDWTRVDDGFFHSFHNSWAEALNAGLVPTGYFAMSDQRAGVLVPMFLSGSLDVNLPAEETYMTTFNRLPAILKAELE